MKVGDTVVSITNRYDLVEGKSYKVDAVMSSGNYIAVEGLGRYYGIHLFKMGSSMQNKVTLNGVEYVVEYIPGKGDCLVPAKPEPKAGELWEGPKGGLYIISAEKDEEGRTQGFELKSMKLFRLPPSAKKVDSRNSFYQNDVLLQLK